MDVFLFFLVAVIIVTMSGALSPGPLLFANLTNAPRWSWRGGLWMSVGHTLIEFPLILLIAVGLNLLINNPLLHIVIGAVGGVALIVFACLQIREALQTTKGDAERNIALAGVSRHPLLSGLLFTGLNPFFLAWWLTAGAKLVMDALLFASLAGVLIMFAAHVWMDYAWLTGTAWLASRGTNLTGSRGYTIMTLTFSAALIYFGLLFCWNAFLVSQSI